MGDLPCHTGRRASALTVNVKQRVKLHQIHRLQLTAAAQRLNDAQQRGQRHAQRRRADTAGISRAGSTSRSIVRYRRSNCAILRSSSGNTRVSKAVSTSRSSTIATGGAPLHPIAPGVRRPANPDAGIVKTALLRRTPAPTGGTASRSWRSRQSADPDAHRD